MSIKVSVMKPEKSYTFIYINSQQGIVILFCHGEAATFQSVTNFDVGRKKRKDHSFMSHDPEMPHPIPASIFMETTTES